MDIVARLLKVLHWLSVIPFILLLYVILDEYVFQLVIVCDPDNMQRACFERRITMVASLGVGVPLYFIVVISRYIIFGRFGWFPWSPFRKE